MKRSLATKTSVLLVAILLTASPLGAQTSKSVELNSVIYPERVRTDIGFLTMRAAPVATLTARVDAARGQTKIDISFSGMKPAILFGGNVTSYVVWAITRDGQVENLGELWVRGSSGSATLQTGQRDFAMMITAEPYPLVLQPSPLVAFVSGPADGGRATNNSFVFSSFGEPVIPVNDSIASLDYKGKDPIDLVQAEMIHEMATTRGAAEYDPQAMDQARITLAQARNLASVGDRMVSDYARRTVALASQAMREMDRQLAEAAMAAEEARREAELQAAQDEAARIAQQLEVLRLQREALEGEMKRVEARASATAAALAEVERQRALMAQERNELEQRLSGALEKVAATTSTARGLVVNLSGILFDLGKATLTTEAQLTVAKLSGVLLMMPDVNLRVEGHTDSTGSDEINEKLSKERARTVYDLLLSQGIPAERMSYEGYGPRFPVASNDTADGRAQNRRVEVVLKEGEVEAADTQTRPE
jgi:outer membrane protein OmpA-like peptidoglycan-associated protein